MLEELVASLHYGHEPAIDLQVFKLLIERKVDLNPRGDTPLMAAARRGNVEGVRMLIAAGADANLKNENGKTALSYARAATPPEPGHAAIIKLLEPVTK